MGERRFTRSKANKAKAEGRTDRQREWRMSDEKERAGSIKR